MYFPHLKNIYILPLRAKPASALGTLVVSLLEFRVSRLNVLTKTTRWKTMFTCHQQPLPQETETTHGHEHTHGTESDLALWSAQLSLVGVDGLPFYIPGARG